MFWVKTKHSYKKMFNFINKTEQHNIDNILNYKESINQFFKKQFLGNYKINEHILKKLYQKCSPNRSYHKKVWHIIYNNKFKTSNLIISNNICPFLLGWTSRMFKCSLKDCVSKENNAYVGLNTTTLSRRLIMHLNSSSSIILHLKTHSIAKSKYQKILVENTIIIAHEINKLRLEILEALHIKKKINRINFENNDNVLKCLFLFFLRGVFCKYSIFLDNILFPLIAFCFLNSSATQFYPTLHLRNFVML